ncbi:protein FAR1-RELATED SEQUENCE 5-like [Lotus japonicus]|uniref:protein FAR1-RELATED SEQUENCE 5-like n=1 Tax=Lotus japonicus TaxID=34305 RepID=UPI002584C6C4|nr:protein FAR1-RELATED SEQUENCE 5-like [Lotus japonicus]
MADADILIMSFKRKVGRSNPCSFSYGFFPSPSHVFRKPEFAIPYVSNSRQRWMHGSEVRAALKYLRGLESNGAQMFWRHKVDGEGKLQHLFWCDGESRFDYKQFGDVLALDTTYGKSDKYLYPVVVFSGVNHHIHTTVFASAIIADETEETFVWLFEQFKVAMEAKSPGLVITSGDAALENAISRVFPNARHRLCSQVILRNASSKVRNPKMTAQLKDLMLSDYEVSEFNSKWDEMVAQFGLEDHSWVRDMYKERKMWATACIRGRCFVGYKASSRCEGFYNKFGTLARSCHNLVDFLQHFHHCFDEFRFKELEADFQSGHGEEVLLTLFKPLERSASRVFTREAFRLFRTVLERAYTIIVDFDCKQLSTQSIYKVREYGQPRSEWRVSFSQPTLQFRCSCFGMETVGIPCAHIVKLMIFLDMVEMPISLVRKRWTKSAKEIVEGTFEEGDGTCISLEDDDEDDIGPSLEDDNEVNFSNFRRRILVISDSDESDVNDGPPYKRRAHG